VPDSIDDETAAGVMMQGLTANPLTTEVHPIRPGDTAVVHAAAGGVGLLLTQMIRARGGRAIGVVSREEKVAVAREAGADHVLVRRGGGVQDEVLELTGGEGADVVYDGGGAATFTSSLQALRHHGTLAFYGPFMGSPTLRPTDLLKSVRLTYPVFAHHVRTREALVARTSEVFELVETGRLRVRVGRRYPLSEAARAHIDIESRRTTGKPAHPVLGPTAADRGERGSSARSRAMHPLHGASLRVHSAPDDPAVPEPLRQACGTEPRGGYIHDSSIARCPAWCHCRANWRRACPSPRDDWPWPAPSGH
jgi:hypothetical protein